MDGLNLANNTTLPSQLQAMILWNIGQHSNNERICALRLAETLCKTDGTFDIVATSRQESHVGSAFLLGRRSLCTEELIYRRNFWIHGEKRRIDGMSARIQ